MKNNKNIKIQHFENNTQTTCVVSSLRGVAVFAFRNAEWRLISYTNPTIGGVVHKADMDRLDPALNDPEDAKVLTSLYAAFEKWSKKWNWKRTLFHPNNVVIMNHAQKNHCLKVGRTARI